MAKNSNNMPGWLENALFYEIYPQSFCDTNSDGIGDFKGIISKLDYICELGCNAIWINPCFKSPFGDAGYDVEDYYTIAPRYGTNEDAKMLFMEAHKRGMHVIFDLVPGHTAITHEWFKKSMLPEKNEFTDRFIWTDSIWKSPEGMGCIRGISDRDGSAVVNFFSHQPALNYGYYKPDPMEKWQQPMDAEGPMATRRAMEQVMSFWLDMGCDGFRVDMAGSLVKNDEDCKGTIALWQDIFGFLKKEYPNAALVSEWGEPDKSIIGGFHMDFLLHFGPSHYNDLFRCEEPFFSKRGKGNAHEFVKTYTANYKKTDGKGLICIPSGNHDMDRLSRTLDTDEMKTAFAFLLTMPGAPFIYYGDEIGMGYVENLNSVEGGYNRTGSRSPMQWDKSVNAGFSTAPSELLYIRQDESRDRPDAKTQMEAENSLRSEVKRLIDFRMNHPALLNSSTVEFVSDSYPLIYVRECETEKITVIINPSLEQRDTQIRGEILYYGGTVSIKDGCVSVGGCSYVFIKN